jgi:hypothetical protein
LVEELNQKINGLNVPFFEAVAVLGKGVLETLTMSCRLVLKVIENGVESSRGAAPPEKTAESPTGRRPQVEKSVPATAPSRPSVRTLRLAREEAAPEPVREPPPSPSRMIRMERTEPRLQPLPPRVEREPVEPFKAARKEELPEVFVSPPAPPVAGNQLGKREEPHVDMLEAEPLVQIAGEKTIEEKRKTIGSSLMGHPEGKKPEPPPKRSPEPQISREKIRILSCGEPRISSPEHLEIPVRVELNGLAKPVLFNINVAIHLEKIDGKID